ncbi:MAG: BON domain-containing protein [Solirubrobacteraceae bacterium]
MIIRRPMAAPRGPSLSMAVAAAACGIALGLLLGYFLDPKAGRRRRHSARDRAVSRIRRGERRAVVRARRAESHAVGIARRTVNAGRRDREPIDDVTLTHKVESELYRRAGVPKGSISINAEGGVVFLRGIMDRQEDIERMEAATRKIAGVREVENLVHMPGTPAPASRPKLERERSGKHLDGSRRRTRHGW